MAAIGNSTPTERLSTPLLRSAYVSEKTSVLYSQLLKAVEITYTLRASAFYQARKLSSLSPSSGVSERLSKTLKDTSATHLHLEQKMTQLLAMRLPRLEPSDIEPRLRSLQSLSCSFSSIKEETFNAIICVKQFITNQFPLLLPDVERVFCRIALLYSPDEPISETKKSAQLNIERMRYLQQLISKGDLQVDLTKSVLVEKFKNITKQLLDTTSSDPFLAKALATQIVFQTKLLQEAAAQKSSPASAASKQAAVEIEEILSTKQTLSERCREALDDIQERFSSLNQKLSLISHLSFAELEKEVRDFQNLCRSMYADLLEQLDQCDNLDDPFAVDILFPMGLTLFHFFNHPCELPGDRERYALLSYLIYHEKFSITCSTVKHVYNMLYHNDEQIDEAKFNQLINQHKAIFLVTEQNRTSLLKREWKPAMILMPGETANAKTVKKKIVELELPKVEKYLSTLSHILEQALSHRKSQEEAIIEQLKQKNPSYFSNQLQGASAAFPPGSKRP